jgi:ribosomal protein L37E
MKKCRVCGENSFWANESYTWKASIDENGVLDCYNPNTVIENIICRECGTEFSEDDFKEVNFN